MNIDSFLRSESLYTRLNAACTPESSSPPHSSHSQLVAAAVAYAEEKEKDVRSFIASLSRPDLITIMQAVDPLHRHSASSKKMMLDYLLKMPISRMSEMISAQPQLSALVGRGSRKAKKEISDMLLRMPVACVLPRVTSVSGPGLADVSWIGQFQRLDDNDFWFYVPPKRFLRRGRCEQSSAVDDARTSHSHDTSNLMHEAADAECLNPAAPMQSHAAGSARSPSVHRADEFPQSEATVLGGQSQAFAQEVCVEPEPRHEGDNRENEDYVDDRYGNVESPVTDRTRLVNSMDIAGSSVDHGDTVLRSSGDHPEIPAVSTLLLDMGEHHSVPIIARAISRSACLL